MKKLIFISLITIICLTSVSYSSGIIKLSKLKNVFGKTKYSISTFYKNDFHIHPEKISSYYLVNSKLYHISDIKDYECKKSAIEKYSGIILDEKEAKMLIEKINLNFNEIEEQEVIVDCIIL